MMFLLGSLLSGIYPAFVLSRYKPVTVLKGLFKEQQQRIFAKKISYHRTVCNVYYIDCRNYYRVSAGELYA